MTNGLLAVAVLLLFFLLLVVLVASAYIERIAVAIEAGNTAFGVDDTESEKRDIAA